MSKYVLLISLFFIQILAIARKDPNTKIIGGNEANIEDYPYVVSVRFYDNHICAGVIINVKSILTSHQCIDAANKDENKLSIRVGDKFHKKGEEYFVDSIIRHPNYNQMTKEFDIAILKLKTSLQFSDKVQQINLHEPELPDSGTVVQFIGWGVIENEDTKVSDVLNKIDEELITYIECNEKYGVNMISHDMFCAQNNEEGFCRGDIGGPLVFNNELAGIASWNYGCAHMEYPDVFVKISMVYNWIIENM